MDYPFNQVAALDDPPAQSDAPPVVDPSLARFTQWVYTFMGVPQTALPPDSPFLQMAYDESINLVYRGLKLVPNYSNPPPYIDSRVDPPVSVQRPKSPSIYAICVYNLGGHILATIAMDDPDATPPTDPPTFWADLRAKLKMNEASLGLVTSASDQGTSAGQQIPSQIADMTLMGLDLMKTPWGRRYMQIAGQWGTLWGIS